VFRYDEPQAGRLREFTQGGVEFIGKRSDEVDAEVIALAISSLSVIGIRDFKIDVGQVEFLDGLFEEFRLKGEEVEKLKAYISTKNLSWLARYVDTLDVSAEVKNVILELPELFGGCEVLDKARAMTSSKKAIQAVENLHGVYGVLKDMGMDKYLIFDLGTAQKLNYYTGIIFKGFVKDIGYGVLAGGRYDHLVSHFGVDKPAVGFAVGLERAMLALAKQHSDVLKPVDKVLIVCTRERIKEAFYRAEEMRRAGKIVEIALKEDFPAYTKRAHSRIISLV